MDAMQQKWQGYRRQSGPPGIRNRVLVIYTVKCSEFVARRIVEQSAHPDVELIGFTSQGLNLGPPDYESVALTN